MRYKIYYSVLAILLCCISIQSFSQSSLYVSAGTNFFITNSTTVFIDGLVLKPSANYNITGLNIVTRDATATPTPATYIKRVYHLLSKLPAYSGSIGIYYQDRELNSLNESALSLNNYDGSNWNVYNSNVTRDPVNNFVFTSLLTNISMNELTLSVSDALPVTMSSFTGINKDCIAKLTWTTASEQNSKCYEVQLSTDGLNFTTVGTVPSHGNSNSEERYEYCSILFNQNNYFRLQMVDIDGNTKYSPVVSVMGNCDNIITAFPNPATNIITVNGLSGKNQLKLLDAQGKLITAIKTINQTEKLNITELPAGTYLLQIEQNKRVIETIKLVKQ